MSCTPKSNPSHTLSFMEKKTGDENEMSAIKNNICNGKRANLYDNGGELGGWGLIEKLCNTSNNTKQGTTETEQVYVHPLALQNSSTLSSKSLEMCTESLGSETGSDMSENNDEFVQMLLEADNFYGPHRSNPDKVIKKVEFPPPLTSISGGDGVLVRPHREGGRLVLEAVTLPPRKAYLQAERVDGRLRLSFFKDNDYDNDTEESDNNEEEIDDLEYERDAVEEGKCNCKDIEDCEEDDDGKDGSSFTSSENKMKKIRCEIEVGEWRRLSRCKEGRSRKGVTNRWETCLAIS